LSCALLPENKDEEASSKDVFIIPLLQEVRDGWSSLLWADVALQEDPMQAV